MFPIKFDKTNIIFLALALILGAGSVLIQVPPGGLFPLVLAVILITFVRTVYFSSGKKAALLLALIFLLIPLAIYAFYYSLTAHTATANTIGKVLPWVIGLFGILLGIRLLYTVAKIVLVVVSPETSNKIEEASIIRDVKSHFRFFLEKGYKISQVKYVNHPHAGWHFQLDSPDDKYSFILDEQGLPLLAFGVEKRDKRNQIYLEAMIYQLTERKVFIGHSYKEALPSRRQKFEGTAKLLKAYLDQIENFSRNDFGTTNNELSNLQKQYVDLLARGSEQRRNLPVENADPIILPILITVHWAWKILYAVGTIVFLSMAIGTWISLHIPTMAFMFGLFALAGIYMFVSAFTGIQVDEKSVTLAAPQGVYRIDWAKVTSIETNTIDDRRYESNDDAFAFMGENKCLALNLKFAGNGKAGFIKVHKEAGKPTANPPKAIIFQADFTKEHLYQSFWVLVRHVISGCQSSMRVTSFCQFG